MAVPVLQLNLAPRPSLWRQRHGLLGWVALGIGTVFLSGTIGFTWRAYHQASKAGREAVSFTEEARRAARREKELQASLQDMDATREQSRWKLAERILQERSLPWSRLTAELEQCMVPDMRLKGFQRVRSNAQQVVLKLKGEARTREAEAAFVEALRGAPVFEQVVLEREAERTGGGWDFELSLPATQVPPPFHLKVMKPAAAQAVAAPVAVAMPAGKATGPRPATSRPPVPSARPLAPAANPVAPSGKAPGAGTPNLAPPFTRPGGALIPPPGAASPNRPAPAAEEEEDGRRPRPRLRDRPVGPGAEPKRLP
ncbi:MAG: hypothetical protein H6P99_2820 [Holophagaceae bacterium]|nr:hypothetical protein [Holophagaceae bacterium]